MEEAEYAAPEEPAGTDQVDAAFLSVEHLYFWPLSSITLYICTFPTNDILRGELKRKILREK